jgi:hypothetical protein
MWVAMRDRNPRTRHYNRVFIDLVWDSTRRHFATPKSMTVLPSLTAKAPLGPAPMSQIR